MRVPSQPHQLAPTDTHPASSEAFLSGICIGFLPLLVLYIVGVDGFILGAWGKAIYGLMSLLAVVAMVWLFRFKQWRVMAWGLAGANALHLLLVGFVYLVIQNAHWVFL